MDSIFNLDRRVVDIVLGLALRIGLAKVRPDEAIEHHCARTITWIAHDLSSNHRQAMLFEMVGQCFAGAGVGDVVFGIGNARLWFICLGKLALFCTGGIGVVRGVPTVLRRTGTPLRHRHRDQEPDADRAMKESRHGVIIL